MCVLIKLLLLGDWPESDIKFMVPGALHQVRMAKAIYYALIIVLFTKQLKNMSNRYLSEKNFGWAFLDERITLSEKEKMFHI